MPRKKSNQDKATPAMGGLAPEFRQAVVQQLEFERDPRLLSVPPAKGLGLAIGLDLGANCGLALGHYQRSTPETAFQLKQIFVGQLDLSAGRWDTNPTRLVRLQHFLNVLQPDVIFYELVRNSSAPAGGAMGRGAAAARVMSSMDMMVAYKTALTMWAEAHEVPAHGFGIQAIKRYATGSGAANKMQMLEACNRDFGLGYCVSDSAPVNGEDNEVDAIYAMLLGLDSYREGLTGEATRIG